MDNGKITNCQLLLPVSLTAFSLFLFLAFQSTQVFRDRDALHVAKGQQDKPLEEAQRMQTQLNALALGTLKLSQQGDKDAKAIIDRMKKMGINVTPPTNGANGSAAPAAMAPASGKPAMAAPAAAPAPAPKAPAASE